jgi:hypothetical protein
MRRLAVTLIPQALGSLAALIHAAFRDGFSADAERE